MKKLPFSEIKLDPETYAVLDELSKKSMKGGSIQLDKLYNYGLARFDQRAKVWVITDEGMQYQDYYKAERHAFRLTTRRYWITTIIAIAAFLLAAASLTWQLFTWQVDHPSATSVVPTQAREQQAPPATTSEPPIE